MPGPRPSKLALLAGCVMLIAGCSHTQTVGVSRVAHVGLTEYRLTPDRVRVSAGLVNFYVHNYGSLTHNLVVSENGQNVGSTEPLYPGRGTELSLDLAPGTYSMASTILSDQSLGASGTVRVTR